jgi:chemotaxis protein methyltransferase CheR
VIETPARWSQPGFALLAELLGAQTGLAFSTSRVPDAEAGFRRAMGRAGVTDPAAYLARLERDRAGLDDLIAELTVGETYFFREPAQFAFIRDQALPALASRRPPDHVLRVWSAGCASGEEAYSLAILLEEAGLGERSSILATDLSRAALAKAAEASYGSWSLRGVGDEVIARHFTVEGNRRRLDPRLRQRVRLESLNLAVDPYPSFATGTWRMDLILCRNVLIYLDVATVRRVVRGLTECLAPDGWLILGPSDPVVDDGDLEPVVTGAGVFLRRRGAAATMAAVASAPTEALESPAPAAPTPPTTTERRQAAAAALARGDHRAVLALADDLDDPSLAALRIRALANTGALAEAERLGAAAAARHPTVELQLLRAVLLIDQRRYGEAAEAARRALYLDRHAAMGHFLLGTALERAGNAAAACRSFRNTRDLCARLGPDDDIPFGDGQRAGRLAQAARAQLELLTERVPA